MTKKQTVLYGEMVEGLRELIEQADGIQRKGLILSALMKFKQLCNHPAQYLGQELFEDRKAASLSDCGRSAKRSTKNGKRFWYSPNSRR